MIMITHPPFPENLPEGISISVYRSSDNEKIEFPFWILCWVLTGNKFEELKHSHRKLLEWAVPKKMMS